MKLRSINTKFWADPYIEDLPPLGKLLFAFLISNDKTNIAGVYEISVKTISYETGMKSEEVTKLIAKFQKDEKVIYAHQWIIMLNSPKHHAVDRSPSLRRNIIKTLETLPDKIKYILQHSSYAMLDEFFPDGLGAKGEYDVPEMFVGDEEDQQQPKPEKPKKATRAVIKQFIPPTEQEVVSYFLEKGYREDVGRKAFESYSVANWKDSRGNQVLNWKQKMVNVWFRDENLLTANMADAKQIRASRQSEMENKMRNFLKAEE